ncbi:uncharacterized protein LOC111327610 isoform X2 [Stylophora pistillata]|uniref:Uncharacterized protein n=1 Tax=Stylophora pistillata TaxID=50429 RepID=A0A2B4SG80_STYPI|nr:uncharacterized protein LOC111327610 isoform X2 [Stylophora pistillata]PFX27455.1 hypothetical protein AWC38_SpisGene7842 [Stylophora pistillata]
METKENMENTNVRVFDTHDREWNTENHQLISLNETGQVPGHYLWVNGTSVSSNAVSTNQKTLFKIHTVIEQDANGKAYQVVILENKSGSVVAINKDDDTVLAKNLPKSPSQYNTFEEVRKDNPEVLFYKVAREPGSELFYFKSYLKDKQRILGFDTSGKPLNTSEVDLNREESWFSVI